VADFDNSGTPGVAITNFDNEMMASIRASGKSFEDIAPQSGVGIASRNSLVLACAFLDVNLDGWLDFAVAKWTHRRDRAQHSRQRGICAAAATLSQSRKGMFREVAAEVGGSF